MWNSIVQIYNVAEEILDWTKLLSLGLVLLLIYKLIKDNKIQLQLPKEVFEKILSGRFILTVICGFTFAYLAVNKILPNEAIIGILILVFEAYFHRPDRKPENGEEKK